MRVNASSMSLVGPAAFGVEIDPGCDGNAGVGQQLRAERQRVACQMRHVGVDVERAVGRRQLVDPDLPQPVEQQPTVGGVMVKKSVRLSGRLRRERRHRGDLGQHRRADGEVARQAVNRAL
jgi:hypothetical protein